MTPFSYSAPIETGQRQVWQLPQAVEKTDSLRFSTDCATVLGWLLNSNLPDDAIEPLWRKLLEPPLWRGISDGANL